MARPELTITWSATKARIRESIHNGRAASGLVGGALLGMLAGELGIGGFGYWQISMQDVLVLSIVCALGSSFGRFLRYLWIADVVLLSLAFLIALTPVMLGPAGRWVRADPLPRSVDAVVVLASSVTSSGTLDIAASDRLLTGLELVRRGVAPRLVTTRVACCETRKILTSDADQRRLITMAGVADRWILIGDSVYVTRDEALAIDRKLRALGGRRVVVVTSPLHTRRACAVFERVGMRVTCVPALERGYQTWRPRFARDRLAAFRSYIYERVGWLVYRRRGWVNATRDVDPSTRNL